MQSTVTTMADTHEAADGGDFTSLPSVMALLQEWGLVPYTQVAAERNADDPCRYQAIVISAEEEYTRLSEISQTMSGLSQLPWLCFADDPRLCSSSTHEDALNHAVTMGCLLVNYYEEVSAATG